jgi:hypothetical protein
MTSAIYIPGTYKLDSDVAFSTDPTTSTEFTRFIGAQTIWCLIRLMPFSQV